MANIYLYIVLLAVASAVVTSQQLIAPRVVGGIPADTLRRFPHHVTIENSDSYICGGSILNEQWILTSASCVDQAPRLVLQFERLYVNNPIGSYSAVVNSDAVHIYPTYYDDIALVKLPFRLVFSDLIKPIKITSQPLSQLENKLAVLPGFDIRAVFSGSFGSTSVEQLNYVMLNVISNSKCLQYYEPGQFEEYSQLCTQSYNNFANAQCLTDYGGGLITGWPARSELIGVHTRFGHDCSVTLPGIYTNVAKYTTWINSLISSP